MWAKSKKGKTLPELLEATAVKNAFIKACGEKDAPVAMAVLRSVVEGNARLKECEPNSVIAAAGQAALMRLPLNPQLGCAHIEPCTLEGEPKGQLHIDTRGWVQLAIRSGEYRTLNATEIYEGEITRRNILTGEYEQGEKISDKVIGYAAYMELHNGFSKTFYMPYNIVEGHAMDYSDSYRADVLNGTKTSVWSKNFNAMAKKTVLKLLLKRYALVSTDANSSMLAMALQADQAVVSKDKYIYADNGGHSAPRKVIAIGEVDVSTAVNDSVQM